MGRKYSIKNQQHLHFVTFTVINWLDIFIRENYRNILYDGIKYCQLNKGLNIHSYCIMSSHVHFIMSAEENFILSNIIRDLKSFTSRAIRKKLETDIKESRRAWFLRMMKHAGNKNERNNDFQFWQQHNHPIELNSNFILEQRMDYIHNNPVVAGLVEEAHYWSHSSAKDYSNFGKSVIEIVFV